MLYHYTSIETLALILSGRKIKFNNLLNVDDPDEAETADLGKFGRYCLVSCWTDVVDDVLPMWNMYTPDMRGVRIGMRELPFKQYIYKKGSYGFTEDTETYINMEKVYKDEKAFIIAKSPEIVKVKYTYDEDKLNPKIRVVTSEDGVVNTSISFKPIGKYKKEYWQFQQEWRYKIMAMPYSIKRLHALKTPKEVEDLIDYISDETTKPAYDEFFLDLADDAFENMEILLGPKTSEAEKIIIRALVDKYCPNENVVIKKSRIKIK